MAEPQSNARLRADAGVPTSGVIHVRTRLTADFTVLSNALVQRKGSAVTVGVAAYILSQPDGTSVSIASLCAHFTEGEILISRALRELEAAGYPERRRERRPGGAICTRTYAYDVPGGVPVPPLPPRPGKRTAPMTSPDAGPAPEPKAPAPAPVPAPCPAAEPEPVAPPPPPPSLSLDDADPQAVVILASLRIVDRRLVLNRREVAELAPAVSEWLAAGISREEITGELTDRLPAPFRARPARLLAYRLRERPVATPAAPPAPAAKPTILPWQTCDGGCERAFRAPEPGRCRDCPPTEAPAGAAYETYLHTAC